MKRVMIIAALFILSGSLFMTIALSGTGGTNSSYSQSSDTSVDSTSQTSTQNDTSSLTSQEISSQDISSENPSSQTSSDKTSSKETSSKETSSKETSSKETSSKETSSKETSSKETSSQTSSDVTSSNEIIETVKPSYGEKRAVWISYLELKTMFEGGNKTAFINNFKTACNNIKNFGLDTVIVHVRPFSDALYESEYFPWSHIITGTQGQDPGFDPLNQMIKIAHDAGLKIEAWINPYRIRTSDITLSQTNPAVKWASSDYVVSVGINKYYNPAYEEVQDLIVNGVLEIVNKYDVDGIHFDDYFYPNPNESFDKTAYSTLGGGQTLGDFRRNNVTNLIKKVYTAVKKADPSMEFGISPQGSSNINYNQQYIDVKTIITLGYIDYVCPQIYYGFENATQPFAQTVKEWHDYVKGTNVKLYVGLAAYKSGQVDTWAGTGKNEWVNNVDILKRQVLESRQYSTYKGFFIYKYESMFKLTTSINWHMTKEKENLQSIF